ncbi:hypothetical protein BURPS1655_A2144 [Burkholderia pseudomallei 1655]|nr:hypothetical protein BURPS1655_A2144 [Burkholderia pseudomallei 1655]
MWPISQSTWTAPLRIGNPHHDTSDNVATGKCLEAVQR